MNDDNMLDDNNTKLTPFEELQQLTRPQEQIVSMRITLTQPLRTVLKAIKHSDGEEEWFCHYIVNANDESELKLVDFTIN